MPDKRRLDFLRRAFLGVALGDKKDPNGSIGLVFLDTARSLTGLQAEVLGVAARLRTPTTNFYQRTEDWLNAAGTATGLHREVLLRELNVLTQALLVRSRPGYEPYLDGEGCALTKFGADFCEFLQRTEPFPEPPADATTSDGSNSA